ncbi:hypothetical protein [Sphingobacterium siyangense]|uniref:hypothetical protein n=1 Tax=Sphingobacterium siyangense TaxID=459529 RepID=UPI001964DB3C|nr:hypothetical protein [Sphingobacterium siyangense]QRY55490.1 hypothetical protein JVX97_15730 [Sphingobacterium siyangense]
MAAEYDAISIKYLTGAKRLEVWRRFFLPQKRTAPPLSFSDNNLSMNYHVAPPSQIVKSMIELLRGFI